MARGRAPLVAAAALVAALCVLAPFGALVVHGARALDGELLAHLARTVLPYQLGQSLLVSTGAAGVACLVASGPLLATVYAAPGAPWLVRLGLAPLLVPPWYLAAIFREALGLEGLAAVVLAEGIAASPLVVLLGGVSLRAEARAHADLLRLLGRARLRAALALLLPRSSPALFAAAGLVFLYAWGEATTPRLCGVPTVVVGLLDQWSARADDAVAALLALGLALFAAGAAAGAGLWLGRARGAAAAPRDRRGPPLALEGPERLVPCALALPGLALGVALPFALVARWAFERLARSSLASLGGDVLRSLALAAAGTLLALVLALPLLPPRGRARTAVLGSLWAGPLAAPSVLLGLAFLWLAPGAGEAALAQVSRALADTPGPLVVSLGVRWSGVFLATFLAVCGGPARAHLELLRGLGRSGPLEVLGALRRFLGPPLLGAGAFVFLQILAELPQTVLLQPFGFETLASRLYRYLSTQRLEDGAAWVLCLALAGVYPLHALARAAGLDEPAGRG